MSLGGLWRSWPLKLGESQMYRCQDRGGSINGGTSKWMFFLREIPIQMDDLDDLGGTPSSGNLHMDDQKHFGTIRGLPSSYICYFDVHQCTGGIDPSQYMWDITRICSMIKCHVWRFPPGKFSLVYLGF